MGKVKVVADFLPSPEELALKDETVKVTISLSKTSVEFFKNEAKKYNIIGRLLPIPIIRTARGSWISSTAASATAISQVVIMCVPCAVDSD